MNAHRIGVRAIDWSRGRFKQLRALVRKRAVERELAEELAYHIELETRQNEAAGMTPAEARRAALVVFGGVERYKEEVRQTRWTRLLEDCASDLRYAARMLQRQRALTLAAVVTLALGIGGTVAVFTVVDALFFRAPAGVQDPGRVLKLFVVRDAGNMRSPSGAGGSYPEYEAMRARKTGFASIAAYSYPAQLDLGRGADVEQVRVRAVTWSFFPLLGVRPALGRFFLPEEDDVEGRNPVGVISNGFWKRHFGGDSAVLGRELLLNDQLLTVIGVADRVFTGIGATPIDVWVPTAMAAPLGIESKGWRKESGNSAANLLGRLQPDAVAASAISEASVALRIVATTTPELDPTPSIIPGSLIPARGPHRSQAADLSLWLALVAAMVLVVACANVANLLLARSVVRRHELAVRLSLGASPGRLFRQHLTESTVLSLLGGATGVVVATAGIRLLRQFPLPPAAGHLDARLLAFTLGLSLTVGCVFGILVALRSAAESPVAGLREARALPTLSRSTSRRVLVTVQVALSLILLIGTGLFVRSLRAVTHIDPGMDIERLMVLSTDLTRSGYSSAEREAFYADARRRLLSVPGVERTAMIHFTPFSGVAFSIGFDAPGADTVRVDKGAYQNLAGPGYFETAGTRLLRGRAFTDADATGEPVVVVNDRMAHIIAPDGRAVGSCIPFGEQVQKGGCTRIVGVVENQRQRFLEEPDEPMLFFPRDRNPDAISWGGPNLMIRLRDSARPTASQLRAAVQAVRADLPYVSVQPLADLVSEDVLPYRLGATLFSVFGIIAIALAAVGLYGVLSYFVAERALEIGIRRSLGASAASVLSLVLRQAMLPVSTGLAIGLAIAFGGTRYLGSLLYGVRARDPLSFATAALFLIAVAAVAALLPARRATRVDPSIVLRQE